MSKVASYIIAASVLLDEHFFNSILALLSTDVQ